MDDQAKREIYAALDAGMGWTAKWIADVGYAHQGTQVEYLLRNAEKAMSRLKTAKELVRSL